MRAMTRLSSLPSLLALLALTLPACALASPRLVSLGGGVTEILFALGKGPQVVGVDVSSLWPPAAQALPKVGYVRAASAEGIASLRPTHVIAPDSLAPPAAIEQLAAAGIRVDRLPEPRTVADAAVRIRAIGALVDEAAAAEALARAVEQRVAAVPVPTGERPAVLFVFVHGSGGLQVGGQGTVADAMIHAAGGRNAARGYTGYRPLTAEAAVAAAPTVILATDRSLAGAGGLDALLAHPGIALTPAGQAKRVVVMDDLLLLGLGPRTGEAVERLHMALK